MGPRQNPEEVALREQEREMAEEERDEATQETAYGLTSDILSTYGRRPFSIFGGIQ